MSKNIYRGQAAFPRKKDDAGVEWVEGTVVEDPAGSSAYMLLDYQGNGRDLRVVYKDTITLVHTAAEDPEVTPRGEILREAEGLITGDRNKNYGSPTENFDTTAALWNAQLGHKLKPGESFTATDVALLMVQLKMARLKTSTSKRDHYLDIAGYIACGWECQEVEDASA